MPCGCRVNLLGHLRQQAIMALGVEPRPLPVGVDFEKMITLPPLEEVKAAKVQAEFLHKTEDAARYRFRQLVWTPLASLPVGWHFTPIGRLLAKLGAIEVER